MADPPKSANRDPDLAGASAAGAGAEAAFGSGSSFAAFAVVAGAGPETGSFCFKADEAYQIGEGMGPVAAYLSIEEVIRVAQMCGADAIHPGYGLLSENPDFVEACTAAGIKFIGPKAETMRALGDKASARKVAIAAGVPVIPATEVLGDDMEAIANEADEIGYPLMLKASWGGGGRGMKVIPDEDSLESAISQARSEAKSAFGDDTVYLEKYLGNPRHIEFQVFGDGKGNAIHLGERDCSLQRRHQKEQCIIR